MERERIVGDVGLLDDQDFPVYTIGQAAQVLGVQQAFLRSLDAADIMRPQRSGGGHRRYSRRQLKLVVRLREQLDAGHSLAAAGQIVDLQDRLAAAEHEITGLRERLSHN